MATVKHPDTYTCDVCGRPFDYESKVLITVFFDSRESEWGIYKLEEPEIKPVGMDICKECLEKALKVKGTYGFCRPTQYRIEE